MPTTTEEKKAGMVSVTEVLSYFKEQWYIDWVCRVGKAEANRVSKASMKVGSRVDELIKSGLMPKKKDSQEVDNCILAYDKWKAVYQPKSIVSGTRLFATIDGVQVTGEPDLFVDDVLVDIKCASKISPSYWLQVNVYKYLQVKQWLYPSAEMIRSKVAILRLDKVSGSYEYVVKDYDAKCVDVWCGMLKAMMYFKKESNDGDEL